MPVACCVNNCKSTWKKDSKIKFYRFPFKNSEVMKYWIAATGRNNWFPYSGARICSLHFTDNDYYNNIKDVERRYLKPDVRPTQNVHASILEVFRQDAHSSQMSQLDKIHQTKEYDQKNVITENTEELMNEENDEATSAIPTCSKCSNCEELLNENVQLSHKIHELQISQEERLNQQANMFHELINYKEAGLKNKLEMIQKKNKTLNKSIERRRNKITHLKACYATNITT